jgi:hypothetical protein
VGEQIVSLATRLDGSVLRVGVSCVMWHTRVSLAACVDGSVLGVLCHAAAFRGRDLWALAAAVECVQHVEVLSWVRLPFCLWADGCVIPS